ncbi:Putative tyrosine-protein kinase F09A5.2 [Toxocara canis]|uniref:Putative tyrosine-protein kinase F09A5.2 n=1 Tax=Toxocara canis TaxID=6265 RepID=A0A0B2UVE0_TOXCA|nr:Putative tyrosine-protein kinase F09A5.2 [Toxocara canis]
MYADTPNITTLEANLIRKGLLTVGVKMLPSHADDRSRIDFLNEIDFMKKLGYHTHIVSLIGCISDFNDRKIVLEYFAIVFLEATKMELLWYRPIKRPQCSEQESFANRPLSSFQVVLKPLFHIFFD